MLIILVLGVWGVIGYKIVAVVNPNSPKIVMQDPDMLFNPINQIEKDTFSVKIVNRDPFLGTLLIKKKSKGKVLKKLAKPEIIWSPIIYHGNISKQDSKTKVFVISIDGQQQLLKIGQVVKGVKLIKGNSKSVVVGFKGVRKTIQKT